MFTCYLRLLFVNEVPVEVEVLKPRYYIIVQNWVICLLKLKFDLFTICQEGR